MRHQRPAAIAAAIAICVVNSVGNGATLGSPVPRPIAYASLVLALIGVIGALGLWRLQRWSAFLSAAVLALTAMLATPGIFFAATLMAHVFAAVIVILDIAGIVLIFLPGSRQAYALRSPATPARSTR
jgi:uncharacterized membrane protein (DUF2068 family)